MDKYIPVAELKDFPTYAETQKYWSALWKRHGCTDPKKNYMVCMRTGRVTEKKRSGDKVPVNKVSKSDQKPTEQNDTTKH